MLVTFTFTPTGCAFTQFLNLCRLRPPDDDSPVTSVGLFFLKVCCVHYPGNRLFVMHGGPRVKIMSQRVEWFLQVFCPSIEKMLPGILFLMYLS